MQLFLFRDHDKSPSSVAIKKPKVKEDDKLINENLKHIRCRHCENIISDTNALFSMRQGRTSLVFANPAGVLFEILTLNFAQNLDIVGMPTGEFSWFPNYAWQIVICNSCLSHLGWCYSTLVGEEPSVFYGLILAELIIT
ncbi:MAG: hypothetical protein JW841_02800 [Deltaproteobacteria bacterium]|nr:hypothetical protein [Deltaproteobacteria bacterium]